MRHPRSRSRVGERGPLDRPFGEVSAMAEHRPRSHTRNRTATESGGWALCGHRTVRGAASRSHGALGDKAVANADVGVGTGRLVATAARLNAIALAQAM